MNATQNYAVCNNTNANLADMGIMKIMLEIAKTGIVNIPEEIEDIFSVTLLKGFNPDGSNRVIVDWA